MSGIIKNALRIPFMTTAKHILRPGGCMDMAKTQYARSLWHMSSQYNRSQRLHNLGNSSLKCSCGCGFAGVHTAGEKELAEFLKEEIATEKKLQKQKNIPLELNGFAVKLEGSEVLMRKQDGDESVEISFNINHSVDSETEPVVDPSADKPEVGEMKSKPNFEVEIKRGNRTIGFTCSIISSPSVEANQEYNDLFTIDELVMYEGEWKDTNYSVAGDVVDGTLYDLLMNFLEDKGINNEFVEKLIDFSTAYEHSCYINMLENIQKFSLGK